MRKLLWLVNGIVIGFVAAHFVNQTTEGRRFFARVNRGLDEVGHAFANGYRAAEAEADELLDEVEEALQELPDRS